MQPPSTLKVAKLNKLHALLEKSEVKNLLESLGNPSFYRTAKVSKKGEEILSSDLFIEAYEKVLTSMKEGRGITPELMDIFSLSMSRSNASFSSIPCDERVLNRPIVPVVQLSPTFIRYSPEDKSFRFGLYGASSFTFGVTFSYPKLFQDSKTSEVLEIDVSDKFPDTELFFTLWKWLREYTTPTPFLVDGKKTNVPVRIGKMCFSWVNQIQGLKEQGIYVVGAHGTP